VRRGEHDALVLDARATSAPVFVFLALVRDIARPAPWHVEPNERAAEVSSPTSTYDAVPMLPGITTGWPMLR
jgi:hypothetical protein